MRWKRWIVLGPVLFVVFLLFIAAGGAVVWQLWNWLMPALFGWPQISFWQALGLLALCRILFGGFGGHRGPRSRLRRKMRERWERMTPEERERFREAMRGRCGPKPPAAEGEGL